LTRSLKTIYLKSFRPVYLIFDQFEELFILGSNEEQQQFIKAVQEILEVEQPVKMIFSMREEYLGYLNRFERAVPQLLKKKLRVEPMNLDKVSQVIKGATTYKNSNVRLKEGEEDLIAEGIFERIKSKEKTLTIQLPYLQVFLDKFYLEVTHDETRQAEALFTSQALNKIGDIGDVLRNFLEEQVTSISAKLNVNFPGVSTESIWTVLSPFATLEGTKEPIGKLDLYDRLPGFDPVMVNATIEAFINSRILRYNEDAELYEIAHDSLAKRISEKRSDEEIALLEIRRLIKSQTSLKADARELFSEKQLNFIEPFLEKIKLTREEKAWIQESYEAVMKLKVEEKEAQEAEARGLMERQKLLEKNQQSQKRFIRWISVALVIMFGLAIWAFTQKRVASVNEQKAKSALQENEKQQAISKATELKNYGDSYKDLGSIDNACDSYSKGLDALAKYPDDALYIKLTDLKRSLKCK